MIKEEKRKGRRDELKEQKHEEVKWEVGRKKRKNKKERMKK